MAVTNKTKIVLIETELVFFRGGRVSSLRARFDAMLPLYFGTALSVKKQTFRRALTASMRDRCAEIMNVPFQWRSGDQYFFREALVAVPVIITLYSIPQVFRGAQ